MKIFVTGGSGFIGCHFLNAAQEAGHELVATRLPEAPLCLPVQREPRWLYKRLDQVTPEDMAGCSVLVHLAAAGVTPQPASWEMCYRVNVVDTIRLVENALAAGVKRVVATGSYAEYGTAGLRFDHIPPDAPLEPTDIYAASKASASIALCSMCRVNQFELVYARLFSVFGEGQFEGNFWPQLRRAALAGADFEMTAGTQVRDFVPVEEVARQLLDACTRPDLAPGLPMVRNLASGFPQTLREFALHWWRQFKATGQLRFGALPARAYEVDRYVPEV